MRGSKVTDGKTFQGRDLSFWRGRQKPVRKEDDGDEKKMGDSGNWFNDVSWSAYYKPGPR
jgi:hypothetical protein